jgi:hypothetical protein
MINSLNYAQLEAAAAAPALLPQVAAEPTGMRDCHEPQHSPEDAHSDRCLQQPSTAAAAADGVRAGAPPGTFITPSSLTHNSSSGVNIPGAAAGSSDSGSNGSSSAAVLAARKVKVLMYTAVGSFLFDAFKW